MTCKKCRLDPAREAVRRGLSRCSRSGRTVKAGDLGVADATEDDLCAARLLARQPQIDQELARRYLNEDELVLYDLNSSYVEGTHCPLAAFGQKRDGKLGKRQIHYGLLTDREGRPVAIEVFRGNTGDPRTVPIGE